MIARAAALAVLSLLAASCALAQPSTTHATDSVRVARLAAAGRLWGRVKYFHPSIATRDIDWDRALVDAVAHINAARSPDEYAAAIGRMLEALGDPATRVVAAPSSTAITLPIDRAIRSEGDVVIVDFAAIGRAEQEGLLPHRFIGDSVRALLPTARAIVLDLRGKEWDPTTMSPYFFAEDLVAVASSVVAIPVTTGSWRTRVHSGLAPQTGTSSGGYYSGLITLTPSLIAPRADARALPIAVVVDETTPAGLDLASGLRAAGLAVIVAEGSEAGRIGALENRIALVDSVVVTMRTAELVGPDGSIGFVVDTVVRRTRDDAALRTALVLVGGARRGASSGAMPTALRPSADSAYASMTFPDVGYRLLALFRFWSAIEFFHPYRALADEPWHGMLERYIPRFERNVDAADYQRTVLELVAEIDDSHGWVSGAAQLAERRGRYMPPLAFRIVEGKWMVTHVLDSSVDARVGDILVSLDGEPAESIARELRTLVAASTPQAAARVVRYAIGRGQEGSVVTMELRGLDGATRTVHTTRSVHGSDRRWPATEPTVRRTPVFGVLESGFGYADLDRLELGQVDSLFAAVRTTPGLVLDMRGYPRGTGWRIASHLRVHDSVIAIFSRPHLDGIGLGHRDAGLEPRYTFEQLQAAAVDTPYAGRVVVLINELAQSQSEHLCLAVESAADVTFIGTPTAGANGDVTRILLPGGLTAGFSGHDVRHADGRQLQRVGIQPDLRVEPTIRGLAEGRDEVLEAAIAFLRAQPVR